MEFTVQQIADYLNGVVEGDGGLKVSELSKIEEGRPGTLTFLSNPKYTQFIYTTQASACLVNKDFVVEQPLTTTLIRVDNAYECLAKLLALVESVKPKKQGISAKADIHESAKLGDNVYVGAFVVIGENVVIGDNVRIYANTVIDDNVVVGADTVIYAGVKIYEGCCVGKRCMLHAGVVVGSDGFGFEPDANRVNQKLPQIGNVIIEDDVEIGANTTVDRAMMGSSIIRRNAKIDNLVQVAHNVEVGESTFLCSQVGIAGSCVIGDRVVIAGQVGMADHIEIGNDSILMAKAGVTRSFPEKSILIGAPAVPRKDFIKQLKTMKKAEELIDKFKKYEHLLKGLTDGND
jgi:UDP-3-O-[3-hydroxymyristoyl] glucosamine N-acyltransferase